MKLMIAGCSFSSISASLPGTSWGEQMAAELGWDLVNLAREGCSNGGIRVQIDEILRQRPDFAVITPTFWDRMEIPVSAAPYDWNKKSQGWDPLLQQHLQNRNLKNGYNRNDGIDNVNYGHNNYNMICETIFSLAENINNRYRNGPLPRDTQNAIKQYVDQIYDTNWKKQQDEWIIKEGIFELHHSGINFLLVPVLLWAWDADLGERQWRDIVSTAVPDRYIMLDEPESILRLCGKYPVEKQDPGYHSSPAGQTEIAKNYIRRMQQDFGIK